ncbi:DUF4303 domain-containing protein [Paenibacillus durus]|uniref:DUF4303 domain-containing protein n=1 Tax=Paenibacillus durus TaxID=44251 RepID=A0A089HSD8_PAEDU|nr:DUF4303 domain-containing protein [Paenibacillus durus]AIQ13987.1 hypothetical protein PDUR_20255 [Paenibacillus durus]
MNTYYSRLGRLLEEKTPIYQSGYYVLCEGDKIRFSLESPRNTEVIDAGKFIDTLVNGSKEVIHTFANSADNQEVYAFSLYTSEHKEVLVYINTLPAYEQVLQNYRSKYPDIKDDSSLKYSLGDYKFDFWTDHMGRYGEVLANFRMLSDSPSFMTEDVPLDADDHPLIAFEAGIIDAGYNLLFLKAMQRLTAEGAFAALNRTDNFIAFASIGDDSLDYSLVMRKTIEPNLFYKLFPDIREKDQLFAEEINKNNSLTASQYLDYWLDAVHDSYSSVFPFTLGRSQYDIFLQMEPLGSALAEESLHRLKQLVALNEWTSKEYNLVNYYVEALYFSGSLTPEYKEACSQLAFRLMEKHESPMEDNLKELAEELNNFCHQ